MIKQNNIIEYSLGDVRITLVNDAFIKLDGNSGFYPAKRSEWQPGTNADDQGFLRMAVRSMLVREPDCITLVDTGFGDEGDEERTKGIVPLLAEVGVTPEQIGKVVITHAHGDHFWGNTQFKNGGWEPVFPNAEYIIQKADLEMVYRTEPGQYKQCFTPLEEKKMLRLIEGDEKITGHITCLFTPGHTPGHQAVAVSGSSRSGDAASANQEAAVFLGDLAIHRKNMERPEWGPDWAWSREKDLESRRTVARRAASENWVLIAGHDLEQPMFRLEAASELDGAASFKAIPVDS